MVTLAVGLALVLCVIGCAPSPPARLAPLIPADQLDLGVFVDKPCELLRAERVSRRHLSAPGAVVTDVNGGGEPACRWEATDKAHPRIIAGADAGHDLEWVYRHRAEFGSFQPTTVSHYPAVNITPGGHTPGEGVCTTRVGVANDSLLTVTADYTGQRSRFARDPCPDAADLAFAIITEMLGSS